MNTELKSMTTEALQALGYRTIGQMQQLENGLRQINDELSSRLQPNPQNTGYTVKQENSSENGSQGFTEPITSSSQI